MSISQIGRVAGCSRNTVRAALASDAPPKYQRTPTGSVVDGVEPRIRELLMAYPTMPATVIAERIGWTRSIRVLSGRVAELRPAYLPPDPAGRTQYAPGEIAQCDLWFPPITLPVGFGQTRRPTQLPVWRRRPGSGRRGVTAAAIRRAHRPGPGLPRRPGAGAVRGAGAGVDLVNDHDLARRRRPRRHPGRLRRATGNPLFDPEQA